MIGRNKYGVNPPPKGSPGWFQRHGKEVLIGTAVVGGVAVIGGIAYTVVSGLTGAQSPACQALENQLTNLQAAEMKIYAQAANQGGTFTAGQSAAVQSLQQQISNVIAQMGNVCISSPGTTLAKTIDQLIVYAGWGAAILVGVATTLGIAWLIRRWGGSKSKPGNPPSSADDVDVSTEFDQATMGADLANAKVADAYSEGTIDGSEASSTTANLSSNDPAVGISGQISDFFSAAAETASEAFAAVLDALAALWEVIVTSLSDLAFEVTLFLGV